MLFSQPTHKKKIVTPSKMGTSPRPAFVWTPPKGPTMKTEESDWVTKQMKLRRRRSIIREFSLNTSTHGLPGMARSESNHNFIFWLISFLAFTVIMIYFVTRAITGYFEYPTQIDVNIIREWPQYFPAVSICNAAIFRFDAFMQALVNYTNAPIVTNQSNTTTTTSTQSPVSLFLSFIRHLLNSNTTLLPYFFLLPSMLKRCTFNSVPCSADDFITFTSASYGLCHTFNAKMKNNGTNSVRYSNQHGGNGMLELELYVHSHLYVPLLSSGRNVGKSSK